MWPSEDLPQGMKWNIPRDATVNTISLWKLLLNSHDSTICHSHASAPHTHTWPGYVLIARHVQQRKERFARIETSRCLSQQMLAMQCYFALGRGVYLVVWISFDIVCVLTPNAWTGAMVSRTTQMVNKQPLPPSVHPLHTNIIVVNETWRGRVCVWMCLCKRKVRRNIFIAHLRH